MAEIALDAVCSREEESSNSSYHKGLSPFMNSRLAIGSNVYLPLLLDPRLRHLRSLSNKGHHLLCAGIGTTILLRTHLIPLPPSLWPREHSRQVIAVLCLSVSAHPSQFTYLTVKKTPRLERTETHASPIAAVNIGQQLNGRRRILAISTRHG
jgi:hypothetical protein